ncbi:hypothetical protein PR048_003907 [Dryococelus australis]|uniref:Uncharacterized protein n=1 Tax=Dryococelus australis TaxID=614101 RepID=A0ABQ9IPI2_9NEOP|nr:hypothetical protein PR048_003907 [Dryococelus australis]
MITGLFPLNSKVQLIPGGPRGCVLSQSKRLEGVERTWIIVRPEASDWLGRTEIPFWKEWKTVILTCNPPSTNCCGFCLHFQSVQRARNAVYTLRRLKTRLRANAGEERFSGLALMSVHREIPLDPEAIILRFAKTKRRQEFTQLRAIRVAGMRRRQFYKARDTCVLQHSCISARRRAGLLPKVQTARTPHKGRLIVAPSPPLPPPSAGSISLLPLHCVRLSPRAVVVQRLERSSPTRANWVEFPARTLSGISHVGTMSVNAAGPRVFSEISRFPYSCRNCEERLVLCRYVLRQGSRDVLGGEAEMCWEGKQRCVGRGSRARYVPSQVAMMAEAPLPKDRVDNCTDTKWRSDFFYVLVPIILLAARGFSRVLPNVPHWLGFQLTSKLPRADWRTASLQVAGQ